MQKVWFVLFVLVMCFACNQKQDSNSKIDDVVLKVSFNPSFDETSEVVFSKRNNKQQAKILIGYIPSLFKPKDTFYFKNAFLSDNELKSLDSLVSLIKLTKQRKQPLMNDGMSVTVELIANLDTIHLYFRNPAIKLDANEFKITKQIIDNSVLIFKDSIITGYFKDVESYIDPSIEFKHSKNDPINRLREKLELSLLSNCVLWRAHILL